MPNTNERDALIAALKFHPSASHVSPDFRDLFNKTLDQHADALAATAPNAGAPLAEVLQEFLEAQDSLDNREANGINAEPWNGLMRRRNAARRDLDAAMVAPAQQAGAPLSRQQVVDRFSFLEGLVSEDTYRKIADTAIEIQRAAGAPQGVCGNSECWWLGALSECRSLGSGGKIGCGSVGPLCPECGEVVEPVAAAPAQQAGAPLPLAPSDAVQRPKKSYTPEKWPILDCMGRRVKHLE